MIVNNKQGVLENNRVIKVTSKGPDLLITYLDELPQTETTLKDTPVGVSNGKFVIGELGILDETDPNAKAYMGKANTVEFDIEGDKSYKTGYISISDKLVKVQGNGIALFGGVIQNIEEVNKKIHQNNKAKGAIETTRELEVNTINGYKITLFNESSWCGCSNNILTEYLTKIVLSK